MGASIVLPEDRILPGYASGTAFLFLVGGWSEYLSVAHATIDVVQF